VRTEESAHRGVFFAFEGAKRFLCTKNLVKGFRASNEKVAESGGDEYRFWEPSRSKLGAAIVKGLKAMPIKPGSSVLYLGAANGITASYVSDIVGEKGTVYCVEFSPIAMKDLLRVCARRGNMLPILADARFPERYAEKIGGKVGVIYEDVADKDQDGIMRANAKALLRDGGFGMMAVKARCVDSTASPKIIFERIRNNLSADFEIAESVDIGDFEADHEFLVLRPRR